jgi:hypothetical protein
MRARFEQDVICGGYDAKKSGCRTVDVSQTKRVY